MKTERTVFIVASLLAYTSLLFIALPQACEACEDNTRQFVLCSNSDWSRDCGFVWGKNSVGGNVKIGVLWAEKNNGCDGTGAYPIGLEVFECPRKHELLQPNTKTGECIFH